VNMASTASTAITALLRNKLRSALTMLGVVIGVAAVIAMQAMGAGATALITNEISSLGSNMLVVIPGGETRQMFGGSIASAPAFTHGDIEAIRRDATAVRWVSAQDAGAIRAVVGEDNRSTTLYGVEPEYFEIRDWGVSRGRLFDSIDQRQAAKVCVIGQTIVDDLFSGADPIGEDLRIVDTSCEIIGVLQSKGVSTFGTDQDDVVFMPHSVFARRISGSDRIGTLAIAAVSEAETATARQQIEALLRERRRISPGEDDDFSVRDLREVQELMAKVTGVLTSVLAGVAGISLLVGGIGIMNIMLVSVRERTREIGIRMAVGARSRDILQQFLVEAVLLAACGGIVGIGLGVGGAWMASLALELPFFVPSLATAIAFGVSVAIGVVFGVFPARQAAKLRPIEALRHE
jgi:putative ABC transport system permease protein